MKFNKLILLVFVLSSCSNDKWEAIVYDDKSNLSKYKIIGVYDSLENCRDNAVSYLYDAELQSTGDYECGLNCEFRKDWGDTRICKSTSK